MSLTLPALNALPAPEFVAVLANVFEHSPWVPQGITHMRPFKAMLQLHQAMVDTVMSAAPEQQLQLIRAHPELAGRAAIRGELTSESTREQTAAGLSACSPQEFAQLQALNGEYSRKFGFPFVLAVKGHDRSSVLAALASRVNNSIEHERQVALREIGRIAAFRLTDLIDEPLGERIVSMCEHLSQFSEQADGLTCSYLTAAHRDTAAQLRDWMLAAGLQVSVDAVGNVIGRLPGTANSAVLATGSHYDTVVNAGKFDGRLGIVLPIAVAAQLRKQNRTLPFTLVIIGFAEEEGVRFKSTFLGSRAIAGLFDPALLEQRDSADISMRAAMLHAGLDPERIAEAALAPNSLLGFVETHIEQGPVLLNEDLPVGVVSAIAGSSRYLVAITGLAGHSGTVPMNLRRDAAAAAAELILLVERECSGKPGLVGTVGQLQVPQGAVNVIAGACNLSIDIRAGDDVLRHAAVKQVLAAGAALAQRRGVQIDFHPLLEVPCVPCTPHWQQQIAASIERITGAAPRYLPSGAGHDAMMMANLTGIGMLFVRCGNGGISHHPDEILAAADAELAAQVFADLLLHLQPGQPGSTHLNPATDG